MEEKDVNEEQKTSAGAEDEVDADNNAALVGADKEDAYEGGADDAEASQSTDPRFIEKTDKHRKDEYIDHEKPEKCYHVLVEVNEEGNTGTTYPHKILAEKQIAQANLYLVAQVHLEEEDAGNDVYDENGNRICSFKLTAGDHYLDFEDNNVVFGGVVFPSEAVQFSQKDVIPSFIFMNVDNKTFFAINTLEELKEHCKLHTGYF